MRIVAYSAIVINILTILVFLTALFGRFNNPKHKAVFGYVMVGSIITYLVFMGLYLIASLIFTHNLSVLWMLLFMAAPFIIGILVKFETLKLYTVLQILTFCGSLWFIFVS